MPSLFSTFGREAAAFGSRLRCKRPVLWLCWTFGHISFLPSTVRRNSVRRLRKTRIQAHKTRYCQQLPCAVCCDEFDANPPARSTRFELRASSIKGTWRIRFAEKRLSDYADHFFRVDYVLEGLRLRLRFNANSDDLRGIPASRVVWRPR